MKKIFQLLFVLSFTSITVSCSSDDAVQTEEQNPEIPEVSDNSNIYKFVVKNFNVSTNAIADSTTYKLENGKIKSSQKIKNTTGIISNTQYSYTNDKIASITTSESGNIKNKEFYSYQNNKLSEFKTESYNLNNVLTEVNKHTFVQTGDTIYCDWNKSSDGINYTLYMKAKIKLESGNTVFYEGNYFTNIYRITMQFDSNGNALNEKYFAKYQGENDFLSTGETNTTYGTGINTFGKIMENTYGREVIMYLSHLESNSINGYRVKKFSRNILNTVESDFGSSIFTINNTINENNFAKKVDYIFFLDGELISKFTQEFYFN